MKTYQGTLFSISLFILTSVMLGFVSSPDTSDRSSRRYEGFLVLPDLTDSVTVYRDERGMPHIYAGNEHDLYFTVGYISAQERLWQMDLIRRSACGRLSEIFGKSFLKADIFTRCLQINEKSKSIIRNEDPEIINCMKAYVDGVNSFINSCRKLPVEFRLLSYKPEPKLERAQEHNGNIQYQGRKAGYGKYQVYTQGPDYIRVNGFWRWF